MFGQFMEAVRRNDIPNVERYLNFVDPSSNDNAAIREALDMGYTEMVGLLLSDDRVDPSLDSNWPIIVASEKGHTEVVRLLLSDSRVDPSALSNLPIRIASYYGHGKVVKLLLSDSRVDPSVVNNDAINEAARNGHIDVVRILLSDPRVDFYAISNTEIKQQLLNEEREKLQDRIISGYKSIEQSSPQIIAEEKQKSQIPRGIIKRMIYGAQYEELCSTIPGKFPPVKLVALADLLKIEYNQNTSYEELCGKVKLALLNLF